MIKENENKSEAQQMAFQAHVEHYKAIRDEINSLNIIQNQLINYSIAVIAGSISLFTFGTPPVVYEKPFILLMVSVLMSAISLAVMEAELRIHDRGDYLENVLRKKIQKLIGNENSYEFKVMKWESSSVSGERFILRGIAASGKFMIAYIPSVAYIIFFCFIIPNGISSWSVGLAVLFWGAVVASLILPVSVLINVVFIVGYYKLLGKNRRDY